MKQLFDDLSARVSRLTTTTYSTSFSLGISFLDPSIRNSIYAIYGFVRLADEIVDSFHGYDKKLLLEKLRKDVDDSVEGRISLNPLLNSFQEVVLKYSIEKQLIDQFLDSMEMDLNKVCYTEEKYAKYIGGSAEAVGLMCLRVFAEGDRALYDKLQPYAMKLGAAFQKINFLRDMKDDYFILGRTYFPGIDFNGFNENVKNQIERDISSDLAEAIKGIRMLPATSRAGVYLAFIYYRSLFRKIKRLTPKRILSERTRINNGKKIGLMLNSMIQYKMNLI